MIADLDASIKKLIVAEIPIENGEIDVKFDQPTREWSAKIQKPTINFFLYDIRENATLRQHQWETMKHHGNGRINTINLKRTPFRVDCHYMITTWAAEPDDEHRLMTRCLLALFRNPVLPENILTGLMQTQPFDIQAQLARHDKLTNPAEVWSALDNELRPSVSYLLTIALDPWVEQHEPPVRSFNFNAGIAPNPKDGYLEASTKGVESWYIGGQVLKANEPQQKIQVAVKGTGFFDTTDENGRFRLGAIQKGTHTLIAWPDKGNPKEVKITIPRGENETYDIEL